MAANHQIGSAKIGPMETMQRVGVICLTNGGCTIVDPERVQELSVRRWWKDHAGYARSSIGNKPNVIGLYLHRVIAEAGIGKHVDHANADKLDNRRHNLRLASYSQNQANAKKRIGKVTSEYKGLSWDKGSWRVRVQKRRIGRFKSEIEAAQAYNAAAILAFGEFARINAIP